MNAVWVYIFSFFFINKFLANADGELASHHVDLGLIPGPVNLNLVNFNHPSFPGFHRIYKQPTKI